MIERVDMTGNPHVTLWRLMRRLMLVKCSRPRGVEPDMAWPAVVDHIMASKDRMGGDSWSGVISVTKNRSEMERDATGRAVRDADGNPRYVSTAYQTDEDEPVSYYGGLIRAIAAQCGLEPKSLTGWTGDEVALLSAKCAEIIGQPMSQDEARRAGDFPYYPTGWRDALALATPRPDHAANDSGSLDDNLP
jgi:hypothetical protein